MSIRKPANKTQEKRDQEAQRGRPFGKLLIVMLLGIIGIAVFAIQYWDGKHFVQVAGTGVIVGGASLLIGGLLGFLFGIPRSLQQERRVDRPSASLQAASAAAESQTNSPNSNSQSAMYQANTNLEQISDWLTKILVGVGLVQITAIFSKLQQIAGAVAVGMGIPDNHAAFPLALILYFLVCGFLFGYLWTRLFLPREFTIADQAAQEYAEAANLKAEIAIKKAEVAQSAAILGVGKQGFVEMGQKDMSESDRQAADPWKERFGSKHVSNHRQLAATVAPVPGSADLFTIRLTVSSTDQEQYPLQGEVQFFLHPTFRNDRPIVKVGPDGVAELRLTAWGAFTVGAVADGGATELELNLSDLPGAPAEFRSR